MNACANHATVRIADRRVDPGRDVAVYEGCQAKLYITCANRIPQGSQTTSITPVGIISFDQCGEGGGPEANGLLPR